LICCPTINNAEAIHTEILALEPNPDPIGIPDRNKNEISA